jgi:hypothetical protein
MADVEGVARFLPQQNLGDEMICSTCDVEMAIPTEAVLMDDRNGIQIWRFPDGVAHVFHARQQAEHVAEVPEQQD